MEAVGTAEEVREAFREGRERARRAVDEVLSDFAGPAAGGDVSSSPPEDAN